MRIQFLLKNTGMFERLGIMTLSSIFKQHGHTVTLLLTEEFSEQECVARVKDFKPHILAYSIMTGEHNYHIDLNQMIRTHYNCFSVFGGPHPTFMPDMIQKQNVDALCRGEGDIYFPQLVNLMERGRDFYNTPNFWFKKPDGSIIENEIGPLAENLDAFPFPDRKLFYGADPALCAKGFKMFISMRGCPYQCTYCFNHAYNTLTKDKGKTLRYRSVDNLIAEIKEVKEQYFLDRVFINDDIFLLKPKGWLEEFAGKYPKTIGCPITCNVRANLVNEKICKLLKQANCRNVNMGVECGNNKIAAGVLKRNLSNEQITKARATLHAYRIKIMTQNLLGLPVDNPLAVDMETLNFNIALKPYFAWSSLFYPYPATELGRLAIQKGIFNADFEKISVSNKTDSALDFGDKHLKRKIVNLHKLFGIIVQFPFLRPFTPFLISLPLTHFYKWMFFAFYGYKVLRQSSTIGIFKSMRHYIVFYFKYINQLEKRVEFRNIASYSPEE
ncbi:MAG: radical SAM protein [Candidatus Omnitrophota bacterium]